jgi:hypothetical protein
MHPSSESTPAAVPVAGASSASAQPIPEPEPSTPLPAKAGFDFAAIKEVIGEAERKPEEKAVPDKPVAVQPPPMLPPANRTVSMLTTSMPSPSPSPSPPLPSSSLDADRSGLTPKMGRAMSLGPEPQEASTSSTLGVGFGSSWQPPAHASLSSSALGNYQSPSTLSFGGSDGSLWADPGTGPTRSNDPLSFSSSFGGGGSGSALGSGLGLGSGNSSAPSTLARNPFSPQSSSLSRPSNPFAPSTPYQQDPFGGGSALGSAGSGANASVLSFGGVDGSISSGESAAMSGSGGRDPWAMPSLTKKKNTFDFNANPWS